MKRLMMILAAMWLVSSLSGCGMSGWGKELGLMLKDVCSGQGNCYAMCPGGGRTNPNDPHCPGEPPNRQPSPF